MDKNEIRNFIARRAAQELHDGDVVNLGIGLPTLIPNFLPEGVNVILQSENGMIGMGPTPEEGRGGHVDVSVLGAMQVDEKGDLANWMIPGKKTPGMGGAMDLLVGAKKVILAMEHTAKGNPKILKKCTLPLTAKGQVNMIITEMGVMEITPEGIVLTEINPEFTVADVQAATEATLIVSPNLKEIR